jgi:microcystin degradation protein MlrC
LSLRIAAAQLSHETNVFSAVSTGMEALEASGLATGQDIISASRNTNSSFGGIITGAETHGITLIPTISVWATPSGMVTGTAISSLVDTLCRAIEEAEPIDGILLALHGAMVTEIDRDGDAYILERARSVVGPSTPIVATLDLHANISQRMIAAADLLIGYDTYPHIDMAERAHEAVDLLVRLIRKEIRPVTAFVKPPMLPTSQRMRTDRNPMLRLIDRAHAIESRPGVLNVTVSGGFPPADVPEVGASILVTADSDGDLAREAAAELSTMMWGHREEFLGGVSSFDEAGFVLEEHRTGADKPIVLVDIADNPWTGGPGDSVELLRFLIDWLITNAAVAIISDPKSVQQCIDAGPGESVDLDLGGKVDRLHGDHLPCTAYVRLISDGRYVNAGPMMAGVPVDLGLTAVVDIENIAVVITSRAQTPIDLNVFRSHGIEPTSLDVIGLKGKGHFRAAFEPIASRVILVEGPGITGADLSRLPFQHIRRPIWPLDPDLEWSTAPEDITLFRSDTPN